MNLIQDVLSQSTNNRIIKQNQSTFFRTGHSVPEIFDGIDNNCNGLIDEGVQIAFYHDADHDGHGNPNDTIHVCSEPVDYVTNNDDCDDNAATIYTGAVEVCDGVDNNCNGQIDENTVTANVLPVLSVNMCTGKTTTLTSSATPGATLKCMKDSVVLATESGNTLVASAAGNYQVIATLNNECKDTSDVTVVTVVANPKAKITAQGSLNICTTGSVLLKANTGTGITYKWEKGNTNIAGATAKNYTATSAGSYKVVVTNSAGCVKTSKVTAVTNSCAKAKSTIQNTIPFAQKTLVFPNPVKT